MEAVRLSLLSAEDYLRGEPSSEERHEYVAGVVYAMAGASEEHNELAGNCYTTLRSRLRGGPGKVCMVDTKVRLEVGPKVVFYYPDLMVTCDPRDTERHFKRYPKLIIEVLSPETERTDRREKFMAYTGIGTLEEYILVDQERRELTVFRQVNGWEPEVLTSAEAVLALPSLACNLSLAEIYEGVRLKAEARAQ